MESKPNTECASTKNPAPVKMETSTEVSVKKSGIEVKFIVYPVYENSVENVRQPVPPSGKSKKKPESG